MSRSRLVARNVLATLATQLVSWALTFAVTLYLPRYVGDKGLGQLAFAGAFATVFGVFVPLGTSTVLVKEIARDRSRTGELLMAAMLIRIPLGLAMTALAIGSVYALGYSGLIRVLVIVSALGMVVGTLNDALASALQGQENLPRQSVAILVGKFLSSGLTIALVIRHAPLWMLAAVGLFTGLVSLLVNMTAFKYLLTTWKWPKFTSIKALLVAGLPFMGYGVFSTLYGQTDPIVLRFVATDATVGWYAAAFRLVGTTLFFPSAIMAALLPTLSRLHLTEPDQFRVLARRSLTLVMLCGIPVALLLILVPQYLIMLMHYPKSFAHSIPVLRVGGFGVFLWYTASVLANLVTARDDQSKMLKVSILASIIGIPACIIGSYLAQQIWHNGAVGAMGSDVFLEGILVICYFRMLPHNTFDLNNLLIMGRCIVASLPMVALLAFSPRNNLQMIVALLSIMLYGGMCWVLRCITSQDIELMRRVFARKVGVQ